MKKNTLLKVLDIVAVIVFAGAGVAALAVGLLKIVSFAFGAHNSHNSNHLLVGLGILFASTLLLSIAGFRRSGAGYMSRIGFGIMTRYPSAARLEDPRRVLETRAEPPGIAGKIEGMETTLDDD